MADQHDRDGSETVAEPVERCFQVMDRRSLRAIPATELEPGPADDDPGAAHRPPDGARDRDHPQRTELDRAGPLGANRLAAVHHDDKSDGAMSVSLHTHTHTHTPPRNGSTQPRARSMTPSAGRGVTAIYHRVKHPRPERLSWQTRRSSRSAPRPAAPTGSVVRSASESSI